MNTQTNEQLRSPEIQIQHAEARESSSAPLERAHAEKVLVQRKEMLASIANDLDRPLHEALAGKIQREWQTLVAFVETDARAVEAKKQSRKILSPEYFTQKPFNPNNF
jgi:hypothetical protein